VPAPAGGRDPERVKCRTGERSFHLLILGVFALLRRDVRTAGTHEEAAGRQRGQKKKPAPAALGSFRGGPVPAWYYEGTGSPPNNTGRYQLPETGTSTGTVTNVNQDHLLSVVIRTLPLPAVR